MKAVLLTLGAILLVATGAPSLRARRRYALIALGLIMLGLGFAYEPLLWMHRDLSIEFTRAEVFLSDEDQSQGQISVEGNISGKLLFMDGYVLWFYLIDGGHLEPLYHPIVATESWSWSDELSSSGFSDSGGQDSLEIAVWLVRAKDAGDFTVNVYAQARRQIDMELAGDIYRNSMNRGRATVASSYVLQLAYPLRKN